MHQPGVQEAGGYKAAIYGGLPRAGPLQERHGKADRKERAASHTEQASSASESLCAGAPGLACLPEMMQHRGTGAAPEKTIPRRGRWQRGRRSPDRDAPGPSPSPGLPRLRSPPFHAAAPRPHHRRGSRGKQDCTISTTTPKGALMWWKNHNLSHSLLEDEAGEKMSPQPHKGLPRILSPPQAEPPAGSPPHQGSLAITDPSQGRGSILLSSSEPPFPPSLPVTKCPPSSRPRWAL